MSKNLGFSAAYLNDLVREHIPITVAMGVKLQRLELDSISITAPLENNVNLHGTGFAGSIYAVMSLTGWAMAAQLSQVCFSTLHTIVLKEGRIKYLRPITGNINAHSQLDLCQTNQFKQCFQSKHRAKIDIKVNCLQDDRKAATFIGQYVVISASDETKRV